LKHPGFWQQPEYAAKGFFARLSGTSDQQNRSSWHDRPKKTTAPAQAGPDVDLFTASADWAIDDEGHYTLTAVYRNGRAPLVLERDNRLTVGLGVKF
jgi:hypothetical protein